jgi:hypothetical protein
MGTEENEAPLERRLLLGIAAGSVALQLLSMLLGQALGYGYFIDELYYIACARRLDFGYVDHPPLSPFVLRLQMALFGDSLLSVRLPSVLAGGVAAYLAGWLAANFGGRRFAQGVAAIATVISPVALIFFHVYSMNGFEVLFWLVSFAILLKMIRDDEPKLWLAYGFVSGLGLLNKHTMATVGFASVVALLLSPVSVRRLLWSRWLVFGGLLAFALVLPNLGWQVANDFASLEFYRNASLLKNLPSPPLTTLVNQILFVNPVTLPLWSLGVFALARHPRFRFVALAYGILLAMLVLSQSSRPDRMAGIYPVLFAAGAVWWERRAKSARWTYAVAVLVGCLAFAPMFLPILSPERAARFVAFVGIDTQMERGEGKVAALPQWLADRIGWREFVADAKAVYESLPPPERERAIFFAPSYGHAGALELFGPDVGLPPVMSAHNTYHLWGRELAPRLPEIVLIAIGARASDLQMSFGDVQEVSRHRCDYCMSWRADMPIHVARQPLLTAAEAEQAWEASRHFE